MLGIKIREQFLSLYANTVLTFEEFHPIGLITDSVDQIQGSYTLPLDIPIDENNAAIIGRIDRLDIDTTLMQEEYCEVWIDGLLYKTGKATIKGSSNTTAKMFIIFNELKALAAISLEAVDLGGDRNIGANTTARLAHAKDTATNPLNHDYVFCPVYNPLFEVFGSILPLVVDKYQNFWDTSADEFIESVGASAMPFIRIDYLLKQVFKALGYTLDNQFQTTDELKKMLLYNNRSIYNAEGEEWESIINLVNHVPYRTALDFVKAIAGTFALAAFPDPFTKRYELIPFRDLILAPVAEDWTSKASNKFDYETDRDFISQFRHDIDENDELCVKWSGVTAKENTYSGEGLTAKIMHTAGQYHYRYAYGDNTYYYIPPVGVFAAAMVEQHHNPVIKTGSDKEYISPLIPLWNSWGIKLDGTIEEDPDVLYFQEWGLPHIQYPPFQLHSSARQFPLSSFRVMMYRGFQPDFASTITYPFANVTKYNILGDSVGDYSLLWDRDEGIYNQWWKLPYQMLKDKKTVRRRLNLTIRDLMNFRFKNKYRFENQNCFLTHLRYSVSAKGLSPIDATMITTL